MGFTNYLEYLLCAHHHVSPWIWGYIERYQRYSSWLQGTFNLSVCEKEGIWIM